MQINEIEISGFKGIPSLVIHPKLINIIVGKNNTGKTSILEAINHTFHANLDDIRRNYGQHLSSLINVNKKESKIILKLENENRYIFLRRLELAEIIPEFKKQLLDRIKTVPYAHVSAKIEWEKVEEVIDKILTKDDLLHEIEKESIRIERGNEASYLFSYTPLMMREIEPLIEYLNQNVFRIPLSQYLLTHSGFFNSETDKQNKPDLAFIKKLNTTGNLRNPVGKSKISEIETYLKDRKILDNLERFDFDKLFFRTKENEYEIPYSFMGEGFKSLVGLIAQTSKETKIILIEEPENHMHPAYIKELISQITDISIQRNIQIFITTHSSDILDVVLTGTIEPKYQEYLTKELSIIQLDSLNTDIIAQEFNRNEAINELEELKIDLRGK